MDKKIIYTLIKFLPILLAWIIAQVITQNEQNQMMLGIVLSIVGFATGAFIVHLLQERECPKK